MMMMMMMMMIQRDKTVLSRRRVGQGGVNWT